MLNEKHKTKLFILSLYKELPTHLITISRYHQLVTSWCRRGNMKRTGKKRSRTRSVPYYGQRPHVQGKRPHPLLCFSWNLRNAFRRAFPGAQECKKKRKEKSRIECLMDLFNFDINQLLIYENRNKKYKKECVTQTLRIMKMKVEEVKNLGAGSKCLEKAEAMLKRRDRLKCVSRSFRRQLIEHMANYDPSEHSSRIMCKIMKELDGINADIYGLCKCIKDKPQAVSSTDLVKESLCSEQAQEKCKGKIPAICAEVMRPYDPTTDEDAKSIHLRYIPELDSFKTDMARNPRAMRLPLMCPPLKRIMNKMNPCYLMDDVPCKLSFGDPLPSKTASGSRNLTVGFVQFGHSPDGSGLQDDCRTDYPFEGFGMFKDSDVRQSLKSEGMNYIPRLWLVASQQLCQIYP